jgi:hypothetical protein
MENSQLITFENVALNGIICPFIGKLLSANSDLKSELNFTNLVLKNSENLEVVNLMSHIVSFNVEDIWTEQTNQTILSNMFDITPIIFGNGAPLKFFNVTYINSYMAGSFLNLEAEYNYENFYYLPYQLNAIQFLVKGNIWIQEGDTFFSMTEVTLNFENGIFEENNWSIDSTLFENTENLNIYLRNTTFIGNKNYGVSKIEDNWIKTSRQNKEWEYIL